MFTPVSFENRPVFIPDLVFRPQLSGENNDRKRTSLLKDALQSGTYLSIVLLSCVVFYNYPIYVSYTYSWFQIRLLK